jgi:hypothetical protein
MSPPPKCSTKPATHKADSIYYYGPEHSAHESSTYLTFELAISATPVTGSMTFASFAANKSTAAPLPQRDH